MPVRPAWRTTATAASASFWSRCTDCVARRIGSEGGKFLLQFLRAAVRAFGSLPVAGAHQDFAVTFALAAMEFVNWHDGTVAG